MRGKYFAYLWAIVVFLLFSITDTLFALPYTGEAAEAARNVPETTCTAKSSLPGTLSHPADRSPAESPMITASKVWKNLACSLSGN